MRYARRIIDDELDELFGQVPAIAIDGRKAVGKTTTAEHRVVGLLRLDAKPNREAVHADPGLLLTRPRPLLIDEWQKVPEVWDVVRRAVDDDPAGGQFLLAGSASPRHGATAHGRRLRLSELRVRQTDRGDETDSLAYRGSCRIGENPAEGARAVNALM
jgi:uncharacterized protein